MTYLFDAIDILSTATTRQQVVEEYTFFHTLIIPRSNWLGRSITYIGKYISYFSPERDRERLDQLLGTIEKMFLDMEQYNQELECSGKKQKKQVHLKQLSGALLHRPFSNKMEKIFALFLKKKMPSLKALLKKSAQNIFSNITGILSKDTESLFSQLASDTSGKLSFAPSTQAWIDRVNRRGIELFSPKLLSALIISGRDEKEWSRLLWNLYQGGLKIGPLGTKWIEKKWGLVQTDADKQLSIATKEAGIEWHSLEVDGAVESKKAYITSYRALGVALWKAYSILFPEEDKELYQNIPRLSPILIEDEEYGALEERPLSFFSSKEFESSGGIEELLHKFIFPLLWYKNGFIPEKGSLNQFCLIQNGTIATVGPIKGKEFSWRDLYTFLSFLAKKDRMQIDKMYKFLHIATHPDIDFISSLFASDKMVFNKKLIKSFLENSKAIHKNRKVLDEIYLLLEKVNEAAMDINPRYRSLLYKKLFYWLQSSPAIYSKTMELEIDTFAEELKK